MSEYGRHHHHEEGEHTHGVSVYEFLGNIFAFSLDETLLYNVCDPGFWRGMRSKLDNEHTHEALDHLEEAATILAELPEETRKMTLDAEYGQAFLGAGALMPPLESSYGMEGSEVVRVAKELGVDGKLLGILPADHIANELFMLVPLDGNANPSSEQMLALAAFFENHPMSLLRHMLEHSAPPEEGSGFYRAITEFALAWLQWDIDAFNG